MPYARLTTTTLTNAVTFLQKTDHTLAEVMARHGKCTLKPQKDYFFVLCDSIISQQLSVKASATIVKRLQTLLQGDISPQALLVVPREALREIGCSHAKALYLKDLAAKVESGVVDLKRLPKQSDEEVVATLVQVKGIGQWTAEMFLMFALGRIDIFSGLDLGLKNAMIRLYDLDEKVKAKELITFAERWKPYRTVACWYLWRSLNNTPNNS
jgi:DNA-3-methyladenine glycosylase II